MTDIPIKSIAVPQAVDAQPSPASNGGGGFLTSLKDAIAKANEIQLDATREVDKLMTGETQNVHQTMIALQKADVSFQMMMQVRNKIVAAYEEIQRMQV
jgi:flagellar hook-basal body complex protein FliE